MINEDVVDTLNGLIEICKDGEFGFATCAEHAARPDLQRLFMARSSECRRSALELQVLVTSLGGKAEDGGTAGGAVHRGWVAVRAKLAGSTDLALLEECERGEDLALERYRAALAADLSGEMVLVLQRQHEGVKDNHAQIRALRDEARQRAHA